jgi:hypothetical protein
MRETGTPGKFACWYCRWNSRIALSLVLFSSTCAVTADDFVLADFQGDFDPGKLKLTEAKIEPTRQGLRVMTGHEQPWPGIALPAPANGWDLRSYALITLSIKNTGTNQVTVFCRVDNPGADGTSNCVSGSLALAPGQRGLLRVPLKRTHDDSMGGKLFGMRGYPVNSGGMGTIDPRRITQLLVFVSKPNTDHLFELQEARATGSYTPPTAWATDADPYFPFIDAFGQYRHKDWPGKVRSLEDLRERRVQEAAELEARPGPKNWDQYGGAAEGPQLKATGFFRTEKSKGKWWLVDPAGHLFFSHGMDCVRAFDSTPVEGRENWFADFPGEQPDYANFRSRGFALKGHYASRSPDCFSFVGANLLRKYGRTWQSDYRQLVHRRLRSWGLNTIAKLVRRRHAVASADTLHRLHRFGTNQTYCRQ